MVVVYVHTRGDGYVFFRKLFHTDHAVGVIAQLFVQLDRVVVVHLFKVLVYEHT